MKIFALLQEPANYTQSLVRNIYAPRGVDFAYIRSDSTAAAGNANAIGEGLLERIKFLWQQLRTHDAIIVNGYTGQACLIAIWLNILFFRRSMALESDTELQIPANHIKRTLKWLWLHFLFTRKYCYGFAGGNYGHKDLFRHYGMAEKRIFLMPMMVDNSLYRRNDVKTKQSKPFKFGYIGRLVTIKQVDKIIATMRILKAEGLDVALEVIGDGECRNELEAQAEGLPVVFRGALFGNEKIAALHGLDALVLYSNFEPWGLVVNEALASDTPVIVSDKVGARKDLVEGENPTGLVAKWNDTNDLVDKMCRLATDARLYAELNANATMRMKSWNYVQYGLQLDAWIEKVRGSSKEAAK